jgi:succinyl-CoA synthetase alpha subunit
VGTAQGKQQALREAGVRVVEHFGDIGTVTRGILSELN